MGRCDCGDLGLLAWLQCFDRDYLGYIDTLDAAWMLNTFWWDSIVRLWRVELISKFVNRVEIIHLTISRMYFNLHRSTKTLKGQLTLNIDHPITMENSAVKPWALAFVWLDLEMHHPPRKTTTFMAMALPNNSGPPSRIMLPATSQKLLRIRPKMWQKAQASIEVPEIPIRSCIRGLCQNTSDP